MLKLSGPIVVFSFDRPQYLSRLLVSLKEQRLVELLGRNVYLIQDGAVSAFSGVRFAEESAIQECVSVFQNIFPEGTVMKASNNLGIAFNIRRGERFVFEELGSEVGYFFEDDLELGPLYMNVIEQMYLSLSKQPNVAYFAAYGNAKKQMPGPSVRISSMGHKWGFGLLRNAWTQIDKKLESYYDILQGRDYGARNHFRLYDLMYKSTVAKKATSQDSFKAQACAELGLAKINTDVCFARYIGEHGVHFNPVTFDRHGFRDMRWVDRDDIKLLPINSVDIDRIRTQALHKMQDFRVNGFDEMISNYSLERMDEDRKVTREDVDQFYNLMLDKKPHGEGVYQKFVGKISVRSLRSQILRSNEYRMKNAANTIMSDV